MLQSILVKGEVSNCKYHSSGHIYFSLKDEKGVINCVMYANYAKRLDFFMKEGQQVIVSGSVEVFERDGKYQLYAKQASLDGIGLLYERYELLKRELEEMGMFSPEYKRPIPKYIRTLGVVTADTGAAIRDIAQVTRRRNPYVQIILYPALVQGSGAGESIANGIRALERLSVDLMIVGRGGGSMEELWAFNERVVAEAAFDCSVPIISAVGHETDTTILDYVADLRASTPSVAAELAVADIWQLMEQLKGYEERFRRQMRKRLDKEYNRVGQWERHLRALSPLNRIRERKAALQRMEERMGGIMEKRLGEKRHELDLYIEAMRRLSPLEKLHSGYSYVEGADGANIRSIRQAKEGMRLVVRVCDGQIGTVVTDVEKDPLNGWNEEWPGGAGS